MLRNKHPRGARPGADDTAALVAELVAGFRAELLGGRGPGAGADELARHMSDRPTVGGRSTAVSREELHLRTERYRGSDPAATDRERDWARPWIASLRR